MEEVEKSKTTVKRNVPRAESDLKSIASEIASSWEQHPSFTLIWTDVDQFKQAITVFDESFLERNKAVGSREVITQELKTINKEIDGNIGSVKAYLFDLYSKKEAPAHYHRFGIVKEQGYFRMPLDNDKRTDALNLMVNSISHEKLADQKYGLSYWTDVRERFLQAKNSAVATDKLSAEQVNIKKAEKETIITTLNSLIKLIQANYPKTWKEELRVWGFQKEKY